MELLRNYLGWRGDWKDLVSGSVAGGMGTIVLHPLDVIKTRFQLDPASLNSASVYRTTGYKAMRRVVGVMIKDEGIKAFYKGKLCIIVMYSLGLTSSSLRIKSCFDWIKCFLGLVLLLLRESQAETPVC
jgi:hypothetical protein